MYLFQGQRLRHNRSVDWRPHSAINGRPLGTADLAELVDSEANESNCALICSQIIYKDAMYCVLVTFASALDVIVMPITHIARAMPLTYKLSLIDSGNSYVESGIVYSNRISVSGSGWAGEFC